LKIRFQDISQFFHENIDSKKGFVFLFFLTGKIRGGGAGDNSMHN
jgi:hypothetical protein